MEDGAGMKIVFRFDKVASANARLKIEDVRNTIKMLFAEYGFPCVADGEDLAFKGTDHEDDYADMWHIILRLLKSEWFISSASSCIWQDEDDEEDVLSQAWKASKLG